jgi:hypothetical protein
VPSNVPKKEPYSLDVAPVVHEHLAAIDEKYYSVIRMKIEEQLTHEPGVETRNCKPVRRPAAFKRNGSCASARRIGSVFFTKFIRMIAECGSLR